MFSMSLLTLDQTTLFYWNLSNQYLKPKFSGTNDVAAWTASIPKGVRPSSRQSTSTPSLIGSGSSRTTATRPPFSAVSDTPALSNSIKICEPEEDGLTEKGAISDRDETKGEEYEAKKNSPLKGQVRLLSKVRMSNVESIIFTYIS